MDYLNNLPTCIRWRDERYRLNIQRNRKWEIDYRYSIGKDTSETAFRFSNVDLNEAARMVYEALEVEELLPTPNSRLMSIERELQYLDERYKSSVLLIENKIKNLKEILDKEKLNIVSVPKSKLKV